MAFGKVVEVQPKDTDRYGRTVGMVHLDSKCVNGEIVKEGVGWVYERYCTQPQCGEWKKLEKSARYWKLGLWAGKNPVPPWEYRHPAGNPAHPGTVKAESSPIMSSEYRGNVSSRVFHKSNCRDFNCKHCTAGFKSKEEALQAGYRPHKECVN